MAPSPSDAWAKNVVCSYNCIWNREMFIQWKSSTSRKKPVSPSLKLYFFKSSSHFFLLPSLRKSTSKKIILFFRL
ncbi:hypothetical protein CDAR_219381 [Caerostris darwini]|uniref:Uncharacterized protein n=1 Tax=Caerostris darwini TaxID=1538125 RepID=A0AAV4TIX0_9ARAC|nr:hypothetical protein CDAR_219381 [Caerostris darwini]